MKKVISFSLWGDKDVYCQGAIENAKLRPHIYPGWVCRFYVKVESPEMKHVVQQLTELGSEVVLVTDERWVDSQRMFWRFWVGSDKTVSRYLIRDCDSRLNIREADAVREWEESGLPFHIMRDHWDHGAHILGGTWGAVHEVAPDMEDLCEEWISKNISKTGRGEDQFFLRDKIWPRIKDSHIAHGTVVKYSGKEVPFRLGLDERCFVGQQYTASGLPIYV